MMRLKRTEWPIRSQLAAIILLLLAASEKAGEQFQESFRTTYYELQDLNG